jgi:T5SS/PEP-CTERM-associated repeat protein
VISNGGQVLDVYSRIGDVYGASNNTAMVTDPGSLWSVSGDLLLSGAYGDVLTISNSGQVAAGYVAVGGANSIVIAGGTLSATNGLVVAGTLTGWGTVNASGWDYGMSADSMQVFSGATVSASCGTLTFTTNVTNYGTLRANGSGVFDFYGAVVNYGTIDLINGSANFHGGFVNNGTVLDSNSVRIANAALADIDVTVQIGSVVGHSYQLQTTPSLSPPAWTNSYPAQAGAGGVLTFSDPGGATNQPNCFYRIVVTAP